MNYFRCNLFGGYFFVSNAIGTTKRYSSKPRASQVALFAGSGRANENKQIEEVEDPNLRIYIDDDEVVTLVAQAFVTLNN